MRNFITLFSVNLILALLQSSFLRELVGVSFTPNLVIAFAASLFFMDLEDLSLMSALLGGIFLDFFGFSIVGLTPLIITGSLVLFTFVKKYLFRGWISNVVVVFLTQVVYMGLISGQFSSASSVLYSAFATFIFSIIFYFINQGFSEFYGESGHNLGKK